MPGCGTALRDEWKVCNDSLLGCTRVSKNLVISNELRYKELLGIRNNVIRKITRALLIWITQSMSKSGDSTLTHAPEENNLQFR